MLQPVKTVPSPVSSAAPTLNRENAASAYSRARRAAATMSISPGLPRSRRGPIRRSMLARRSPSGRPTSRARRSEPARRAGPVRSGPPPTSPQPHRFLPPPPLAPGVAALRRRGVGPVPHGIKPLRVAFVAHELGPAVALCNQQGLPRRGELLKLLLVAGRHVDERHRQAHVVRVVQ